MYSVRFRIVFCYYQLLHYLVLLHHFDCLSWDSNILNLCLCLVLDFLMVKAYKQEHVYKHPWERVSAASWRKFADPENKRILSHILEVDTLNRKLDTDTGKLHTTRALTIHAPGPWFLHRIIGQDICHCVESTVVDAKSRSMQVPPSSLCLIEMKYLFVVESLV